MYYNVGSPGSSLKLQWHIVMRPPGISRSHYKGTTWTVEKIASLRASLGQCMSTKIFIWRGEEENWFNGIA